MSCNDPIADLICRIRNASNAFFKDLTVPYSNIKEGIVKVLVAEGYLGGYEVVGEGTKKSLVIFLSYSNGRKSVIHELKRISHLGGRAYIGKDDIRPLKQGVGMYILTTPKGVMSDREAKKVGVGGEVLCSVW